MKRADVDANLLERLIADERSLPTPERDWGRIEQGILARLAEPVGTSARRVAAANATVEPPARSVRSVIFLGAGLAAAAGLALFAASLVQPEQASRAAPRERPAAISAGKTSKAEALAAQAPRKAGAGSGHAEHDGRAHWTLEPGSVARVRHDGAVVVIELDSGSIDAEVEPGHAAESFVVEAGDVRVAVHGTEFRVERQGEMVDVSVWEGVVSVHSKAEPLGMKLAAPASKRWAFGQLALAEPTPAHAPTAARGTRSAGQLEPTISEVEAGVSRIQAAAQACFARHTTAKDGVQVSVRSSVALAVRPDGSVVPRGFDPPLHPAVDACTRAELAKIRFATSQRGIELSRALELGR